MVGFDVGGVEVAHELQCAFEVPLDDVELEFEDAESLFDVAQLTGEAYLFALEKVERERTGVVGLEKLGSFVERASLAGDELLSFGTGVLPKFGDLFEDDLFGL